MADYVIYGKIIIDDVRLIDGTLVRSVLGGGGPQAVFGARLWSDSVGFLSRSGTDMGEHADVLRSLGADLAGWKVYEDIPTPRTLMQYDENQYMKDNFMLTSMDDWSRLLAHEIALPEAYQQPRGIHLITEFNNEPMVHSALALKEKGAVFSLEPLINHRTWKNRDEIISLLRHADTASPDWPSASGIAGSDDPLKVLKYWSKLGPSLVTVRHGAQGSYVWDNVTDCIWHIPAVPTEVVDPTGAGNCYGGGAFVGWVEHRDGRIAATYGGVSAVFLVRRYGLPPMTKELQQEAQQLLEQALDRSEKL